MKLEILLKRRDRLKSEIADRKKQLDIVERQISYQESKKPALVKPSEPDTI